MSLRILVLLDGTSLAEGALRYAEVLVRTAGGQLKVFRASVGGGPTDYIERALDSIATRLRETGVPTDWSVVEGEAVPAILDAARSWQPHFVAMTTSRSSGLDRWLNDGVADAIVRSAEVPVLVVPPDSVDPSAGRPPTQIMVPLDGSALAEAALGPATELARSLQADVILLRVIEEDTTRGHVHAREAEHYIQTMRDSVQAAVPRLHVIGQVASGTPTVAITRAGNALAAGLIAMSTHGRGGLARVVQGSTATATLEHSIVPLLLVGPAAMTASLSRSAEIGRTSLQGRTDSAPVPALLAMAVADAVEEQGGQSFPASDPPSWTGSTI